MKFCGHCGRPVAAAAPSEPAPPPPEPTPPPAPRPVDDVLRSFVSTQVADRLIAGGGELTEERRLVTALFADLSGFTRLAGDLDPEQLLEVIDPVIRGLTNIVGAHGGYVEKFAGDALLAFFGAPVAHEDDAERALRVALEMHARLPGLTAGTAGSDLSMHAGINSGHVVARVIGSEIRMDYAVLGDAVILAQRLESLAPNGETYVGASTYQLVAHRFELEPLAPLQVKGRTEPVIAWRLVGEKPAEDAGGRLFGRASELERAHKALARLQQGKGAVLAVLGQAGVGKTRLVQQVRRSAADAGATWYESRCLSSLAAVPYRPYAELLRSRLGVASATPPSDVEYALGTSLSELGLQAQLPYLARLLGLPRPPDEADELEPQALRRALDDAVVAWVRALAEQSPTVLALEDVHWADPSSADLTRHIMRRCFDVPLAMVLTGRPEAGPLVADLTEGLEPEQATIVELGSLNAEAIADLVGQELGGLATPALLRLVETRSGGNPLFAREMIRSMRESGGLIRRHDIWTTRRGLDVEQLPPTVEGLLSARMDLLPQSVVPALQTAAVIGRRVPLPMLTDLLGGRARTDPPVDVLVDRGFLDRSGWDPLVFPHVLVQDAAYSRLLRRQQRELHARVAEAAERLYGAGDEAIELLARHLYLARAGRKAVDYLVRAGLRAAKLFANDEATTHLERAVELVRELPDERHMLAELLLELAQVHEVVGRYDDALRLYDEVRSAFGDMRAWRGAAAVLRKQGRYDDALSLLGEATTLAGPDPEELASLELERGRTQMSEGRFRDAIESLERGAAIAPSATRVLAHLLLQLTRAQISAGDPEAALDLGLDALEQLRALQDTRGLSTALRVVGDVYGALGQFDKAAATLHAGLEQAERVGDVEEIGGCLLNLGMVEIGRGQPQAAIESSRRALVEFDRVGHQAGAATAAANLAEWLLLSQRPDDAAAYCQQALDVAEQIGDRLTIADATLTRALIHLAQGQPQEAARDAEHAAAAFAELGVQPFVSRGWEVAANAWEAAGDSAAADIARRRLETATGRTAPAPRR